MKIGELARATATPVETIRFYEREGLMPAPARTGGNYRAYADAHLRRLVFIRKCRSLDMALDEIRALLDFKDRPADDCGEVNAVLDEHIRHVAQRIEELRALEQELLALRARCGSDRAGAACEILKELAAPGETGRPRQAPHVGALHRQRGSASR